MKTKKKNAGARRCVICTRPKGDTVYREKPIKLYVHKSCLDELRSLAKEIPLPPVPPEYREAVAAADVRRRGKP